MRVEIRWRKALVVSLLFHLLMLGGMGWLSGRLFDAAAIPEQYVELDLVSDYGGGGGGGNNGNPLLSSSALAASADAPPAVAVNPEQARPVVTLPEDLSVLSAPTVNTGGASEAGSASTSGTGTGSGNGSGGGSGSGAGTGAGSGGGTGSGAGRGRLLAPSVLSKQEPVYPEQARRAGQQGTVLLRVQILPNGRSGEMEILQSSGSDSLDDAALAAVRQWRFIPAKEAESGQAVECYTKIPVVFRLQS